MPMGTDSQVPPPADPRDALIASLQEQLAALQSSTPVASVQPVQPTVQPIAQTFEQAAAPVVQAVEQAAAPVVQEAENLAENAFTHFIHLADGRVLKMIGSVTHWFDSENGPAIPVIGVYPK